MNKIIKNIVIAGAIYVGAELTFAIGKAKALGILMDYDQFANEMVTECCNRDKVSTKFIGRCAKYFSKEIKKNRIES